MTVDHLIYPWHDWNMAHLLEHFLLVDVEQILKLKLLYLLMEAAVFWHFDPCGMYIVKSGYNLVVKI